LGREQLYCPLSWAFPYMEFVEGMEKNWGLLEQNCFLKDKVVSEWCGFIIIGKWCVVEFVSVMMVIIKI